MLLLLVTFSIISPQFATFSNFVNLTHQGAVLTITALGMMIAIISAGIDLSVGALIGLCGTMIAITLQLGVSWPVAVLVGVSTCSLAGIVSGLVITKGRVYPFIVTFGMLFIAQSVSLGLTNGGSVHISDEGFQALEDLFFLGLPIHFWISLAIILFVVFLLRATAFGSYLYAIGHDAGGAALMGINVDFNTILVYLLSATLAGVAGTVLAIRVGTGNALIGQGTEFDAIAAVVIGGTPLAGGSGSILGTVLGAIVITVLRNGLNLFGLSSEITVAVIGISILLAVVMAQTIQRRAAGGGKSSTSRAARAS
jgi:ribose transport system permease protein